jgi:allantoate deiminase
MSVFFSGTTVQDVLKLNSFEATAAALSQAKYSPGSVGSYVEVWTIQGLIVHVVS